VYTGLRPGEKLFEELFYSSETVCDTNHAKIKRTQGRKIPWADLSSHIDMLRRFLYASSENKLRYLVKQIVPEYQSPEVSMMADLPVINATAIWKMSPDLSVSASEQD